MIGEISANVMFFHAWLLFICKICLKLSSLFIDSFCSFIFKVNFKNMTKEAIKNYESVTSDDFHKILGGKTPTEGIFRKNFLQKKSLTSIYWTCSFGLTI